VLETAARHKEEILLHAWKMSRDQIERGRAEAPRAYVFPRDQRDPGALARMIEALRATGVRLDIVAEATEVNGRKVPAGSVSIALDQPARAYIRNLFERQTYPLKEKPYDVAGWTLQFQMGLEVIEAAEPPKGTRPGLIALASLAEGPVASKYAGAPAGDTAWAREAQRLLAKGRPVYRLAARHEGWEPGSYVVAGEDATGGGGRPFTGAPDVYLLKPVRLGLYQPWRASMDEGWTRLVLEQFEVPYVTLQNPRMKQGALRKEFDAILLPDIGADILREGRSKEDKEKPQVLPPEYQGGIGKEGVEALRKFVEEGGTLICLSASSNLPIEDWGPPVRNTLKDDRDFSCPGSLLKVKVDPAHFLGFGMAEDAYVYVTHSPAFQTSVPARVDLGRTVVARYDDRENPLASGYLNQPEKLLGKSALVEVAWGKGRIVLFGFRPQHRAQTYGTFKMLFNAIQLATAQKGRLP
jgi:hypothetical protein